MHSTQNPPPAGNPVRIFTVPPAPSIDVLFLGPLRGLLTHWLKRGTKGRSVYCPGPEECLTANHRLGSQFKAYAAAEIWLREEQVWRPVVFEATPNLEHYLRGRTLRGEVWRMSRFNEHATPNSPPAKNDPVVGAYCERFDEHEVSPAFAIEPILARFYGVDRVVLGAVNPMPPQVVMADVIGRAPITPPDIQPTAPPQEDPRQREKVKKSIERNQTLGERFRRRQFQTSDGAGSSGASNGNGHA